MSRREWGFYGRREELDLLTRILSRNRWFFVRITGRRRIGKTSLVQEALKALQRQKVLYVQIPDSDPAGVVSTVREFFSMFGVVGPEPRDLRSLAARIGTLVRDGWVVALDEFQYFHRASLFEFTSHLQYEVDRLARDAANVQGGLVVLGSIHTEMAALLEDRSAPLFNRVTDSIDLPHLDLASVLEILRSHADTDPYRLLFLWNLFEGVPKFYRDCHEQDVLDKDRRTLLKRMFFTSSSPLRHEADNWFLRELRGRYDLVLKYVARHPGCTNRDVQEHVRSVDPSSEKQVGGYIKVLRERYGMIERLQPVFARPTERNGRFYIRDNFLRSWLAALSVPAASVNFRPMDALVEEADQRLEAAEGRGLEQLAATLYEERSRKGKGGFQLTSRICGYWDRQGTEVDLVALDEESRTVRLGTCKRSEEKLLSHLGEFDGHVERFLAGMRRFQDWTVEKVAIAPRLGDRARQVIRSRGYIPEDLEDLTGDL
ncbi:ATP-binding protein [Myxococcota bacterium]|nr:ATP-binding protein [Myxococcota bacterium]